MEFDENYEVDEDRKDGDDNGEGGQRVFGLEEDEEMFVDYFKTKKDVVLFMVDINADIFKKNEQTGEVAYLLVMNSLEQFMKSKIISSPEDRIGLVFFNTEKSNILDFSHQFQVFNMDCPSAESILQVKKMRKIENYVELCGQINPNSQQLSLRDLFWNAGSLLLQFKQSEYYRRVFLFTSDDQPHANSLNKRQEAVTQAIQLLNSDIGIELFPLRKSSIDSPPFNIYKFYSQITTLDSEEINESSADSSSKIYDLQTRIRTKLYKKRYLNRLLWSLGDETKVGIRVMSLYAKARLPFPRFIHSEQNKVIKKITKTICVETGKVLLPSEIGYCVHIDATTKVPLSKLDSAAMKEIEEVGIILVGFKDSSTLKPYQNYRASYFMCPDEQVVTGSSQFFHALIEQMIAKGKYAIVKVIPRKGTQLRFACLIPQKEEYSQVDHTQTPPGFHLIFLPYADDTKITPEQTKLVKTPLSSETVKTAQFLVNCLEIKDFDFRNFEDPSLSMFYAQLQALALHEKDIEQVDDLMQPDEQHFEMYQEVIDLFQDCLKIEVESENPEKIEVVKSNISKKRKSNNVVAQGDGYSGQKTEKETKKRQQGGLQVKSFMNFGNQQDEFKQENEEGDQYSCSTSASVVRQQSSRRQKKDAIKQEAVQLSKSNTNGYQCQDGIEIEINEEQQRQFPQKDRFQSSDIESSSSLFRNNSSKSTFDSRRSYQDDLKGQISSNRNDMNQNSNPSTVGNTLSQSDIEFCQYIKRKFAKNQIVTDEEVCRYAMIKKIKL